MVNRQNGSTFWKEDFKGFGLGPFETSMTGTAIVTVAASVREVATEMPYNSKPQVNLRSVAQELD